MKVFAVSDLHLASNLNKPMDIFGEGWTGHFEKIKASWYEQVSDTDIVLIAGDISWAMALKDVISDLAAIGTLPGTKFIIRGNHDYWWNSYTKVKNICPPSVHPIQNNAERIGNYIICGTRGWTVPEEGSMQNADDKKIFEREIIRLKLSLEEADALKRADEEIIVMLHYPPFNSRFSDSPFTELCRAHGVKKVVYGHLHGNSCRYRTVVNKKDADYYLTSCDQLDFQLMPIC